MSDQHFRDAMEGLRDAAQHLITANQEIAAAVQGVIHASDAVLSAKVEHEDLRDTVQRLEGLVMDQGRELRELRAQLGGPNGRPQS